MKRVFLVLLIVSCLITGCAVDKDTCKANCKKQDMKFYKHIKGDLPSGNTMSACWCILEDDNAPLKIW